MITRLLGGLKKARALGEYLDISDLIFGPIKYFRGFPRVFAYGIALVAVLFLFLLSEGFVGAFTTGLADRLDSEGVLTLSLESIHTIGDVFKFVIVLVFISSLVQLFRPATPNGDTLKPGTQATTPHHGTNPIPATGIVAGGMEHVLTGPEITHYTPVQAKETAYIIYQMTQQDYVSAQAFAELLRENDCIVLNHFGQLPSSGQHSVDMNLLTDMAIRRAQSVFYLRSPEAKRDRQVQVELGYAKEAKREIITLETTSLMPIEHQYEAFKNGGLEFEEDTGPIWPPPKTASPLNMHNPFLYGGAIPDEHFVGRKELLEVLPWRIGLDVQSISIVANRRMGKTSLLTYIAQRYKQLFAEDHAWVVVYLDMTDARTQTVTSIMRLLRRRIKQRLGKSPWHKDEDGDLAALVEGIESLTYKGINLVLCLDEWESVMAYDELNSFIEQLRSLGSRRKISMIVASAHELITMHKSIATPDKSQFFNIFEQWYLGLMPQHEWAELVDTAFTRSGIPAKPRDISLIGKLAGGHPYLTQIAGSIVWKAEAQKTWRVNDIQREFDSAARSEFMSLWASQNYEQKMAIRQVLGLSPSDRRVDAHVWDELVHRGVLNEDYEVFSKSFADFIITEDRV